MPGSRFLRETVVALGWTSQLWHRDLRILSVTRSARFVAAAIVLCAVFQPAAVAITINMEYYNEGDPVPHDENPSWDPNGSILKAHFQVAKSIWESLLPGPGTYDLTFEWDDDIGTNTLGLTTPGPNLQTLNNLVEINPIQNWFADPTPGASEEFMSIASSYYSGLSLSDRAAYFTSAAPPGNLEVRAVRNGIAGVVGAGGYDAASGYDLLSTIVHELGHVLGVNIEPGDFNIDPQHIGGVQDVTVLENNGHLGGNSDSPGFLMCDSCGTTGVRRIPTATDVLVIAEDQGISDVHLERVARISAGNWNNTNAWIGADVPDATQDTFVRQAGAVTLDVNAGVKSLVVTGGSSVDAAGFQLASSSDITYDGGAISVGAGGVVSADAIRGDPATLTTAAGSTIQFNDFTAGTSSATAATFNGSVNLGVGPSTDLVTFNPNAITAWTIGQNLFVGASRPAKLVIDDGAWSVVGNLNIPKGSEAVVDGGTLDVTGSAIIGGALTYKNHHASNTAYSISGGSSTKRTTPPPTVLVPSPGGKLTFENTAIATTVTAASATIFVGGGTGDGAAGGVVTFKSFTGADHAQFWTGAGIGGDSLRISNPVVIAGTGGRVSFEGNSKADLAHFRNDGVAAHGPSDSGGSTYFNNNSNAFGAVFDNYGSTLASWTGAVPAPGGRTAFFDNAKAGFATFNNFPGQGMGSLGAGVTVFNGNSSADHGTFYNKGGVAGLTFGGSVEFYDTATADNATFYNEDSLTLADGANAAGNVRFYGSSTAGNATFHNQAGGGTVYFNDTSTAGDGNFVIEDTGTGTFYGHVRFNGSSKGGNADITIKENCFSASVEFWNSSNAEQAQITLVNGSQGFVQLVNTASMGQANVDIGSSSQLLFRESSTAANSTIRLRPGGSATFSNSATPANATLNVDGATVSGGGTGSLYFAGGSVGNAIVNISGGAVPGANGGYLEFASGVNAGNVTVIAAAGVAGAGGGRVGLSAGTDASNAHITIGAGGNLNITGFGDPTIGSLDVAGSVFLGQTGIRIGALNTSNTISGPIGGYSGNGNARLTKVGTGTLTLSAANTYAGLTKVDGGILVMNGTTPGAAEVNSGAMLKGTGTIGGTVTLNSGGTLSPGASPGTITIGNLTMNAGSALVMEIGGTTPGSGYDRIQSGGALAFGGSLQVTLIGGFTPSAGQSFDLFNWGSTSGVFSNVTLPTLPGLSWNTSQLYTTGIISLNAAGVLGDYNNDGVVNASDYIVWRKGLGTIFTQVDYDTWRTHFGQSAGTASHAGTNTAVPEPLTSTLVFAVLVFSKCFMRCTMRPETWPIV